MAACSLAASIAFLISRPVAVSRAVYVNDGIAFCSTSIKRAAEIARIFIGNRLEYLFCHLLLVRASIHDWDKKNKIWTKRNKSERRRAWKQYRWQPKVHPVGLEFSAMASEKIASTSARDTEPTSRFSFGIIDNGHVAQFALQHDAAARPATAGRASDILGGGRIKS